MGYLSQLYGSELLIFNAVGEVIEARRYEPVVPIPGAIGGLHGPQTRFQIDSLASHIFVSRRQYRNMSDTKSGKRTETALRLSWQTACELGFRGSLGEWERLMGAAAKQ